MLLVRLDGLSPISIREAKRGDGGRSPLVAAFAPGGRRHLRLAFDRIRARLAAAVRGKTGSPPAAVPTTRSRTRSPPTGRGSSSPS